MKSFTPSITKSILFKKYILVSISFIAILLIANKIFDGIWGTMSAFPVINLYDVYSPPPEYDNITRINLKLSEAGILAIEGNKQFKLKESTEPYNFYDSVKLAFPKEGMEQVNKIYLQFEDSPSIDSIFLVVSKSETKEMFWKQIFLSSVTVNSINKFSENPGSFRVNPDKLVSYSLLTDNDTLINQVITYFNAGKDTLKIAECGTNSMLLIDICKIYKLPCRIVGLQGGDVYDPGFNNQVGYPLHALCEVYSSRYKKWYVLDPTYGFRFNERNEPDYLNAVEISNKYFFMREHELYQDSVFFTKRSTLGRDYFKYFENIYYTITSKPNYVLFRLIKYFYGKFNQTVIQYSNNMLPLKNGLNYLALKSLIYFLLFVVYLNIVLYLLVRRLYILKKDRQTKNFKHSL